MAKGTVNKCYFIGRLGADPEMRYTTSNVAVTQFRIATNEVWKDKDGTQQEKTDWHQIVAWRRTAENVAEYCKKGSQVYVEGKLQTRQWQDKDGNTRYTTEVIADQVQFLGGGNGKGTGGRSEDVSPPSVPDNSGKNDDLPF